MSVARGVFLESLDGIRQAVVLQKGITSGAIHAHEPNGILILRRGILIAALIALETFIRERTTEVLVRLGGWPANFDDLPKGFRDASLIDALLNLQKYAKLLKSQGEDYQEEIVVEMRKMISRANGAIGFTKFVSGDHTGNISEEGLKKLLGVFQVRDCWSSFRVFCSEIGFGVPSVQAILTEIIRKRHRSAHAANYAPAASDINDLAVNLLCIGACYDAAVTASVEQALENWSGWGSDKIVWRDAVELYLLDVHEKRYRLTKYGVKRALRVIDKIEEVSSQLPRPSPGKIVVLFTRDITGRPFTWQIS